MYIKTLGYQVMVLLCVHSVPWPRSMIHNSKSAKSYSKLFPLDITNHLLTTQSQALLPSTRLGVTVWFRCTDMVRRLSAFACLTKSYILNEHMNKLFQFRNDSSSGTWTQLSWEVSFQGVQSVTASTSFLRHGVKHELKPDSCTFRCKHESPNNYCRATAALRKICSTAHEVIALFLVICEASTILKPRLLQRRHSLFL